MKKTDFATPDGLYEFNAMLVVLCNAPTTFDSMIDTVLDDLKWKTSIGYLDEVVIFLFTFIEHLQRLDEVLSCLSQTSLQLIRKKMPFRQYFK